MAVDRSICLHENGIGSISWNKSPSPYLVSLLAGSEAPDLLPLQHRTRGKGSRVRLLGPWVACLDLLPQGRRAVDRAVAGQPAREAVRGQVRGWHAMNTGRGGGEGWGCT